MQLSAIEIVDRVERDHRLEAVVGKRQLGGGAEMQPADDLRLAFHQRIIGDVEPKSLQARDRPS